MSWELAAGNEVVLFQSLALYETDVETDVCMTTWNDYRNYQLTIDAFQ